MRSNLTSLDWVELGRSIAELAGARLISTAVAIVVGSWLPCHAAELAIHPLGEFTFIDVSGNFEKGDASLFAERTANVPKAIVALRSDGGSLLAGISIGETIRSRGFATLVPANSRCASACALAWLGGTPRYMAASAQVGFHAAYDSSSGNETGVGNAILGAYVNKLGLSYSAVIYITQASPASMTWLSAEDAKKNDIEVKLLEPFKTGSALAPSQADPSHSPSSLRAKVSEFVRLLFTVWSGPNDKVAAVLPRLYSVHVLFYGRDLSDNEVVADKMKSINRWPQRLYKMREGSLTVECNEAVGSCKASGIVDWMVRSPARNAQGSGSSSFEYTFEMRDGPLRITAEGGSVISRLPTTAIR
ncbi:hypothetical protein [Bradyrhizobium sp. 164]|uniref:COG3904 family protein n=1 Tax=Bradyrhizobium sp. 164 TaxID=2782637 RepID=UPI001FF97A34|nr:hypothetical protein [Bradyrhizobium sp. 164]MCK1597141.1 hypothetical protein [Bradyrhizobium sp. 164]